MKIAFYGTLMRGFDAQRRLRVAGSLQYQGQCRIPGELWDLDDYPGLVEGAGEAAGELYSVLDEGALASLDAFEGVDYLRRELRLVEPRIEAWVYVFTGDLTGRQTVPSGCWRTHALKLAGSRSG